MDGGSGFCGGNAFSSERRGEIHRAEKILVATNIFLVHPKGVSKKIALRKTQGDEL